MSSIANRLSIRSNAGALLFALLATSTIASGQGLRLPKPDRPNINTIAVMSGLSQPILFRGANIEVEYLTRNVVMGWSHGVNLQIDNFKSGLSDADRAEQLALKMPWTTGPSVGVRVTNRLNLTVDFKAHRVNASQPGGASGAYTVYTIGPALGYVQPIGSRVFVQPFLRWWPTVGTSLEGETLSLRRANGSSYSHKPLGLGFVPNVKIGIRF